LVVGAVLALALAAATGWMARTQYRQMLAEDLQRGELQAREVQEQAQRVVGTASLLLGGLADGLAALPPARLAAQAPAELSRVRAGLPLAQELALLDADGHVLASTHKEDTTLTLPLRGLSPLPAVGTTSLGQFIPGRGWADLGTAPGVHAVAGGGLGFVPLLRALALQDGRVAYLAAQLDLQGLSALQAGAAHDADAPSTYLLTLQGQLLASSGQHALPGGANLAGHPVFRKRLTPGAQGAWLEDGPAAQPQLRAFSASAQLPLLALVEQPSSHTLERWFTAMRSLFAVSAAIMAFLLASALLAWRAARARDEAQRQLAAARQAGASHQHELDQLMQGTQALQFEVDPHGRLRQANARWLAILGQPAEQAAGRPLADWTLAEDGAQLQALFQQAAQQDACCTAQVALCAMDGTPRHLALTVRPLWEGDRLSGYAGYALDQTACHAARQALQQQLDFTALLLEVCPQPLAIYDDLGGLVTVNQAWEKLTGYPREQVLGNTDAGFQPAGLAREHAQQDAKLWANGGRCDYPARVQRRDGSQRDVMVAKLVVPADGSHAGSLLCSLTDVSVWRHNEREQQSARLAAEACARALVEQVARVGQEFCTPLQSALGYAELGLVRGQERLDLVAMFEDIHASGRQMAVLLDKLLELARAGSAVPALGSAQRMDLRTLVDTVLADLGPQLHARQLRLRADLGPQTLLARVDVHRLSGVLRQLFLQSIQACPLGGRLQLDGHLLRQQGQVWLRLRHPGASAGANAAAPAGDSALLPADAWTLCQNIVATHGGQLKAEPASDGGTQYALRLPACDPAEPPPLDWVMPERYRHLLPGQQLLH
jgi:PAS domain S-box-containing protein